MSKGMGEKVSGTKADLYERVTRCLAKAGFWGEEESEGERSPRKGKKLRG